MKLTLLPTGRILVQDQYATYEVGPDHPDYKRLRSRCGRPDGRNFTAARMFGAAMVVAGIAGFLYNRHLAATSHEFYIKLCVFAPLAVFGGLLMAIRPEWAGPYRPDSSRNQKIALFSVIGLMA